MGLVRQATSGHVCSFTRRSSPTLLSCSRPVSFGACRSFSWFWRSDDCPSARDESSERHALRRQRTLKYKYSRAIRRRQLWDRDPSHNALRPTWRMQLPDWWRPRDGQGLSSNHSPEGSDVRRTSDSGGSTDSFARLKAYIDSDPFGAVFGHRLTRNELLGSISYERNHDVSQQHIFPKRISVDEPPSFDSAQECIVPYSSEKTSAQIDRKSSIPEPTQRSDVYEFDPISMRKVLKSKSTEATPAAKARPLFDPLFAEKSVDIPVKPYKPYKPQCNSRQSTKSGSAESVWMASTNLKGVRTVAESSRKAELRKLKTAALGNSIDTSAEYHGKFVAKSDDIQTAGTSSRTENLTDDAPTFSGTIYDTRKNAIDRGLRGLQQDWLHREGFTNKPKTPNTVSDTLGGAAVESTAAKSSTRIQPSLDRLSRRQKSAETSASSIGEKRASGTTAVSSYPNHQSSSHLTRSKIRGPLDLLQNEDPRTATNSSHKAKQQGESGRDHIRKRLEYDYESSQQANDDVSNLFMNTVRGSVSRFSKPINGPLDPIRAQPKEGQPLGDQRSSPKQAHQSDLESEAFNSKKSIEAVNVGQGRDIQWTASTRTKQSSIPSRAASSVEKEAMARTSALTATAAEIEKAEAKTRGMETSLAQSLLSLYEAEYGCVSSEHRQPHAILDSKSMYNQKGDTQPRAIQQLVSKGGHVLKETKMAREEIKQKLTSIQDRIERTRSSDASQGGSAYQVTGEEASAKAMKPLCDAAVQHQKPAKQSVLTSVNAGSATSPTLYKILAYDSSTLQMTMAETTSSSSSSSSFTAMPTVGDSETQGQDPTEILSRLNNVAKFLPYFAQMEKEGYEIVSGSGDVLVFKKVRSAIAATTPPTEEDKASDSSAAVPVDQRSAAEQVIESILPNSSPQKAKSGSRGRTKIHRQEPLFSGSVQDWHAELLPTKETDDQANISTSESEQHRTGPGPGFAFHSIRLFKRIIVTASAMGGVAYAVGVVVESAGL